MGAGYVIRDHHGNFVVAKMKSKDHISTSVRLAELSS